MTLDYAFEKYDDNTKLRRSKHKNMALSDYMCHDIGWLKGLYAWGDPEHRKLGFIIPSFMIEDSKADDWELVEE